MADKYNLTVRPISYHDKRYSLSQIEKCLRIGASRSTNVFNLKFTESLQLKTYNKFWKLDWPEFILGSDTHAPFVHPKIFDLMLKVRDKYKIPNFIHPGDFFDELCFNTFPTSPEDNIDWNDEMTSAKEICKVLTDHFKEVYFTLGNHDVRFWKLLIAQSKATNKSWEVCWKLLDNNKIHYSKYRYAEINGYWRLTHPKSAIRIGGAPAMRIRAKYDRSMIFAHGHWYGEIPDPSGKYYLIAPGCLCDPNKIGYVRAWDTAYDEWHPGFLMVVERKKHILFDLNSPWGIYLKK